MKTGVTETKGEKKSVRKEGLANCAIFLQSSSRNSKVTIGSSHLEVTATVPRAISLSHLRGSGDRAQRE